MNTVQVGSSYAMTFNGTNTSVTATNSPAYNRVSSTVSALVQIGAFDGNTTTRRRSRRNDGDPVQKNAGNGYAYAFYKTSRHSLVFELQNSLLGKTVRIETADGFVVPGSCINWSEPSTVPTRPFISTASSLAGRSSTRIWNMTPTRA